MGRIVTVVVMLGVVTVPSVSVSQTVTVEAETFTAYGNIAGAPIGVVGCSYASGGQAVDGFDIAEEWVRLLVTFPEDGLYANRLRSAGPLGLTSTVRLTLVTASKNGDTQVSEIETYGDGIG